MDCHQMLQTRQQTQQDGQHIATEQVTDITRAQLMLAGMPEAELHGGYAALVQRAVSSPCERNAR